MSQVDTKEDGGHEASDADPVVIPVIGFVRLQVIIAGLWLSLFMSAMDTTIITTGLIRISSEFKSLNQAPWLVTTYLLTYNSFLMLTAKFSDVLGLKTTLVACNIFFLIFSMACGGAKTMLQLIIFRAFQGIGGSGMYSLVFVAILQLITPEKSGFYSGVISSVFAIANLLGPVLGGVIVDHTTWRWIFWINGPIVATCAAILFFSIPGLKDGKSMRDRLRGFDIVGGILSVCWPIPLLFALQEAGARYGWSSGVIIGTLVAGISLLLIFGLYETWITYRTVQEAVFPIRFLKNPIMALHLLSIFLLGMPFYVAIIQLPQRFQTVNHTSAERAGILLLPVTLLSPVGAMLGGLLMGKTKKFTGELVLIIATALVCIGIGLLSSLPVESYFPKATYGYEIITGFALGLASPPYFYLLYTSIDEKDIPVGTGAMNMFRTLGGCVAIAICTALHNSVLRARLPAFLNQSQISSIEDSSAFITHLPEDLRNQVGVVFGHSYNRQFQVMLGFSCLNFLVAIALALARKRKGVYGMVPVIPVDEEEKAGERQQVRDGQDAKADNAQTEEISVIGPKEIKI
ncbi:putative MFS multidrug transporter [Dendryphion nanum]|uniref:MFS multidrug transporter n=1 Tax=Dendryphion nanum TaxID=256645 RepID=A0A9P9IU51_9PLEO|nr:putative MFS multidrug transporter [Dendryphion nanum]